MLPRPPRSACRTPNGTSVRCCWSSPSPTSPSKQAIQDHLAQHVAKWWLPDDIVFVEELPHSATGKLLKTALRDQFKDYVLPTV